MKVLTPKSATLAVVTMAAAAAATMAVIHFMSPPEGLPQPVRSKDGGAVSLPDGPKVKDSVTPYKLQRDDR